MKKILLVAIAFLAYTQVEAQVTFRPGIRAGVNFSHFTHDDTEQLVYNPATGGYIDQRTEFKSTTDFYAGIYGALKLTRFYTLQPEIDYSRQGAEVSYYDYASKGKREYNIDVDYVSIAVINKFSYEGFNVHLGPSIDIMVNKSNTSILEDDDDYFYYYNDNTIVETDVDFALNFGLGYNFTKSLGIEARVKKGLLPVLDYDDNHTNVVFSAGLTYTINAK